MKKLIFPLFAIFLTTEAYSKDCPMNTGKYGNNIQYQDMFCRILVNADKTSPDHSRNVTINDDGMIQVFSNFPGTTNSNSTGARVYYVFPLKTQKKMKASSEGFILTHPSGVEFDFDKNGKLSSSDIKMKVSSEINSKNKSGVEIESFSKGLVVDFARRKGASAMIRGLRMLSDFEYEFQMALTNRKLAADIETLGETVRRRVRENSGVELEWEIKRIGKA